MEEPGRLQSLGLQELDMNWRLSHRHCRGGTISPLNCLCGIILLGPINISTLFWTQFEAFQDLSSLMISGHGIKSARKFPTNFKKLQIIVTYYSDFVLKLILA